jgi:hypothetical protein
MASSFPVASRNAALDAIAARRDGGYLRVYAGIRPADGDTALSGETLLAEGVFDSLAYAAASGGVATANPLVSMTVSADGTAAFFRCFASDGTTPEGDGDVGTSSAEMILDTVSLTTGGTLAISSLTLTQP